MTQLSTYKDFKKNKVLILREHEKIISKYNIEFSSLKGIKIPLVCLYEIVLTLFENNSINLKISDIILLTLSSIGMLSKENIDDVKKIIEVIKEKRLLRYLSFVKNTIKSIKNLLNIIFKREGVVIQNIEQALKYRYAVDVMSLAVSFIRTNNIKIEDFCYWYIVDQRNKESKELIYYIEINYY